MKMRFLLYALTMSITGLSSASMDPSFMVTSSVDNASPIVNDPIYFFITVTNTGSGTAQSIVVRNLVPSEVTFVSSVTSQGSYTAGDGLWNIGSLAVGESAKLALATTVNNNTEDQPFFNFTELIDAYGGIDCYGSDSCFATVEVSSRALCKFDGVSVQDSIPLGTIFCSSSVTTGHYDPYSGVWDIGRMNIDETQTLTLTLKPTSALIFSSFDNVATLNIPYGIDAYDSNNEVIVTVKVVSAIPDVAVEKRATNSGPNPNEAFSYVVNVTNTNPVVPTDSIMIQDVLPPELMFCSSFATQGVYVVSSDSWNVGVIPGGGSAQLVITVVVDGATAIGSTITNIALFTDPYDNDFYDDNNSDEVDVVVEAPKPCDLAIDKIADKAVVNEGEKVTFTVTVNNTTV